MSQTATLSTKLTATDVEFNRVLDRAEQRATTFSGKLEQKFSRAESALTKAFKRDPGQRAENALSSLIGDISTGNVATGITGLLSKINGIGLVAGVAVGAGIEIFNHFKEKIEDTRKAHEALREEMVHRPVSVVGKLSEEGMSAALGARQKLLEDAAEKSQKSSFGSEILEGIKAGYRNVPIAKEDLTRVEQQKQENQAAEETKQIMLDRSRLAMSMVAIQQAQINGQEKEAKIAQIVLEAEQKRAALQASGVTHEAYVVGEEAISRNAEMQIESEKKRADVKEQSMKIEEKMASLISKGLGPEDQKKVRTGLELQQLQQQLGGETSDVGKRNLRLQISQKQNELRGMTSDPNATGPKNPFAWGTIGASEWENKNAPGFGSIAARAKETEDPTAFGTLAYSAAQRGEIPEGKQNSQQGEVVKAINDLLELTRNVWMKK